MNPLIKHKPLFEVELKKVDEKILSLGKNRPELIKTMLHHIVSAGGKRLRPIILILSAKMLGGKGRLIIDMAACVELLHTATLFHDDVVDESKMRRGKKTANELWGNAASVLVGDFLLAQAFAIMSNCGSLELIDILSRTSSIITEGEIKQLMHKADITTSVDDYVSIITSKTAELFAGCARVGAVIAGADEKQKLAMEKFGRNLGVAFQISDDALDYFADEKSWGKKLGDDFREGKATLPAIYTYSAVKDLSVQNKLQKLFSGDEKDRNDKELKNLMGIMGDVSANEYCMGFARDYSGKGAKELFKMPGNKYKEVLEDILDFSIEREG